MCRGGSSNWERFDDRLLYDAFVSYRHQEPDQSWVRRELVPRLEADGLRVCIDYRDFAPGASSLDEMGKAVEQSRHTLAVLSPAYLTSEFTEFEIVAAAHLAGERRRRSMLAVVFRECEPPAGMRLGLKLDMTDKSRFDAGIERLVRELRRGR